MKRSKHNLSHYHLFTGDMGQLIPVGLTEVLPGDSMQQSTSLLLRVSPLVAPVMHPVQVRIHHWFVPHRIIWDGWEDFITGGPDNLDNSTIPVNPFGINVANSIADYYGIPPGTQLSEVSALPFRGYEKIYNEFYRDQDLIDEVTISPLDMPLKVAWGKDYFTAARPWPQKGSEVTLPLSGDVDVIPKSGAYPTYQVNGSGTVHSLAVSSGTTPVHLNTSPGATGNLYVNTSGLVADLSTASAITVNDLRKAMALQRYNEARARYGSRYTEYLRYLGVRSSDARLQRPEYLGGGKTTISFSEVLKTGSGEDPAEPIGTMKGHGIAAVRSRAYRRFFEEHGYIHTFVSVRPVGMYTQGINRTFLKSIKEDFWQRELEHIGQQEVYTQELYSGATKGTVFGYSDRYAEYRRGNNRISADFRDSLDYWHLGRVFSAEPVLNQSFIDCEPSKRINAIQTEHVLWVMAQHRIAARRLVTANSAPRIY